MAAIPRIGTQISAPIEPANAAPQALLLKANTPPMILNIIPTRKEIANNEAAALLPPNPTSRMTQGNGVITHVVCRSSFASRIRAKTETSQRMLKIPAINMSKPAIIGFLRSLPLAIFFTESLYYAPNYRQSFDCGIFSRALNDCTSFTTTLHVPSCLVMVPLIIRNGDLNLFSWLS